MALIACLGIIICPIYFPINEIHPFYSNGFDASNVTSTIKINFYPLSQNEREDVDIRNYPHQSILNFNFSMIANRFVFYHVINLSNYYSNCLLLPWLLPTLTVYRVQFYYDNLLLLFSLMILTIT